MLLKLKRKIFIYLCDLPKHLEPSHKMIDATHINGGYNWDYHNIIVIFRKEEMYKVLIHEMLHAYGVANVLFEKETETFTSQFAVMGEIKLAEAIVEIMAMYFYTRLMASYYHQSQRDILKDEIIFSVKQTAKVLNHFGFKDIKQLWEKECFLVQDTCVFSYIILKTALYFILNDILTLWQEDPYLSDYAKNISLLQKAITDKQFQKLVNQVLRIPPTDTSLRMTYYHLPKK